MRPWDRGLSHSALPGIASRHLDQSTPVAIFTDSQSLCMALLGSYPDLDTLRPSTNNMLVLSHIQWIPGHCDIRGNILEDSAAKFTTTYPPLLKR